jgi:hypothetical protein
MRSAAGLDPDKTRRQLFEKSQDPAARQTLPDNNLPSGIDPMDLKN